MPSLQTLLGLDVPVWLALPALLVVGVCSGFANALAGGGTLVSVPALILLGLPADVANGTARLGVIAQSAGGAGGFAAEGRLDRTQLVWIAAPAVLGALGGALAAVLVPRAALRWVLIASMLAIALLLVLKPRILAPLADAQPLSLRERPVAVLALFAAGAYGGFIQGGVGFVLLAVLGGILRYDLVRANALKSVITLIFTLASFGIFVAAGDVQWLPGLVLAVGALVGAQLAVKFAVNTHAETLRRAVLGLVVVTLIAALLR